MNEHNEHIESAPALIEEAVVETVADEVEVDALTEAIDSLAKAMKKDDEPKSKPAKEQASLFDDENMDDEDMDDEDMDDEDMDDEDMEKGLKMYGMEEAMKAMADGTDRIVADMEKRMSAMMKGMEAMLEEMKAMRTEQGAMAKSLNAVAAQPVAPRAVTSASVAPVVVAPVVERGEMIRKALTKLQSADTDAPTRYRLRGAIAQLESGAPLSHDLTSLIG
ncbi:MAG: hypothetical protein ACO395_02165 [Pontimonas sp.]